MKYMLDTNTCIYIRRHMPHTEAEFEKKCHLGIGISTIVLAELEFGVHNSIAYERNYDSLQRLLSKIEVLAFDKPSTIEYAYIRKDLQKRGLLIGSLDMLIAAHAKSLGCTLVTNNTREFERVNGLRLEDWKLQPN